MKGEAQAAKTARRAYRCGALGQTDSYERGRLVIGLERRGRVKRSHDRGNWEQEDFDACDRQAVRLACLLDGSRMSREVQVRFYESPVV